MKLTGLSGHIRYRGLGIIDVESKIKALKAAWVYRLKESDHCITCQLYVNSIHTPTNIDLDYLILTVQYRI